MFIEDWERSHVLDIIYLMEEEQLLMKEINEEENCSNIVVIDQDHILNENDNRTYTRTFSTTSDERILFGSDFSS